MHRAMGMLRRRIDGVELDGHAASVDQVMPFSSRYKDDIVIANPSPKIQIVGAVPHDNKPLALLNPDKLIYIGMHFQTYVSFQIDAHQGKLQIITGPQGSAIIVIADCGLVDVNYKGIWPIIP